MEYTNKRYKSALKAGVRKYYNQGFSNEATVKALRADGFGTSIRGIPLDAKAITNLISRGGFARKRRNLVRKIGISVLTGAKATPVYKSNGLSDVKDILNLNVSGPKKIRLIEILVNQ